MMKKLLDKLVKNKKVLVLGYGREGRSTLKLLLELNSAASLTVSDMKDVSAELPNGVGSVSGEGYLDCLNDFDLVFKTPGIVLPRDISEYTCEITSQTEVFIEAYKDKVIGITGTKGKSTTSSFIYFLLKECGKNVLFAGNIGIPVFDIASEVADDTIIVIELSCHQLEYAKTSPHRAILLNIYEDHLDHYGTREKYGLAKKNIYIHQEPSDYLYTLKEVVDEWGEAPSETVYITKDMCPFKSFDELSSTNFKGEHNLLNLSFAYAVSKAYGISDEEFIRAVETFETLPHRLEKAGTYNGVEYYDDSISTTVKSTISAVESIKNATVLLVGGMERNIDYSELISYVLKSRQLKNLICMYESGKRIYSEYCACSGNGGAPAAYEVKDLEEAVSLAKKMAVKGEAVLLSPAAASYGHFKNFEERGDRFKELVKKS